MAEYTLKFPKPHAGQRRILQSPARFIVGACGRRFGKTEIGKRRAIRTALNNKQVWWLMPTHAMSTHVWDDLKHTLRALGTLITIRESERRIKFLGSGSIAIKSTHSNNTLRGAGLDFAILDEAAFMHRDIWAAVVRPMLLERKGSALFLSTPFGRNHFWELYQLGLDPLEPDWASFHFPSGANPLIDPEELARIQRTTPERIWREEYLAEFLDDSGAVFRRVREAIFGQPLAVEALPPSQYVIGVDLAKSNDYTVFAVVDMTTRRCVLVDRMQGEYTLQLMRLQALAARIQPVVIIVERNIGEMFIEQCHAVGLPVQPFLTTNSSKQVIIENLALAFERSEIGIPDDEVLIKELLAFEVQRLVAHVRYAAPEGLHDDTVIALALAWHGCMRPTILFEPEFI